nr:hypothetical protein [Tanacetum cinerariifolium]
MATSTTEAEYVAAASGCRQVLWIQNQLLDYGDCFETKLISVDYIHTDENVADLLTKPFDAGRFQYLVLMRIRVCVWYLVDFVYLVYLDIHVSMITKAIKKGAGPNWLFDIDSLTKSMNYVPVVTGTNSTNLSGTKDAASQEVKKDVSSLRYIALPNWVHDALLESSSSKPQGDCSTNVLESSGNFNPTATSTNPSADQMETLTVETPIPTVCLPVPTACFTDSQEPSSDTRLISKRVANQVETPSLDNILTLTNQFEDILGVTTNSDESNGVMLSMPCEALSKEISSSILVFPSFSGRIVPLFDSMLIPQGEGSGTPTESHHTPTSEASQSSQHELPSPSLPPVTTVTIPPSSALPPIADEPASSIRDNSQEEACLTDSGLAADQDRANIAKTSTLPSDSAPRVTSLAADERTKRVSDDAEEMATVLTSMDAGTVLASGVAEVPTGSGSIPTADPSATGVPTGSDVVPTAGLIFATATVVTPYTRRKGKEKMIEFETPKKKKIQEQMDIQIARQLEEEMERDAKRMNEQIARDAEIARIYAEEELQMMINSLDRSNETVAKYIQEYEQILEDLSIRERIELISDLVKYQENYAQVLKYQTLQRKPRSKKQKKDYYMAESAKKLKTSEEVPKEVKSPEEVTEEKVKEMMQLVPIKEVYVEALQVKHPIIDWKNLMHAPVEWKLYNTCGVHHVTTKDKEIFMLVEKDYPIKKGLAIGMISYKLQGRIVGNKMHKAFLLPVIEFPLSEEVLTASEESSHCQKKRDATAEKIALLLKSSSNYQLSNYLQVKETCGLDICGDVQVACVGGLRPHGKGIEFKVSLTRFYVKPSRDFTRPLGLPSGLKGLLHTLNATVISTKLYRMVEIFEMVNVARGSRLGACWTLYKPSEGMGEEVSLD